MTFLYLSRARIPSKKAHVLQIHKMCDAFVDTGHDVRLYHPTEYRGTPDADELKHQYNLNHALNYRTIPCLNFYWLRDNTARLGFLLYALSYCFCGIISVIGECLGDNTTVVYARDRIFALFLVLLRPFLNVTILLELHDLPRSARRPWSRWLFKGCDGLVVITHALKQDLIEEGIPEEQITVEPDGVDPNQFDVPESQHELRRKLDLPEDPFLAGYVGHLYPFKGTSVILDLAKALPDVQFVTVGGFESDRLRFREELDDTELTNVQILEHQPHSKIPQYLNSFDVLLLPLQRGKKRERKYSSPLKLFEYMAAGKPILASDIPALREILKHDENALLADPEAPEQFASQLSRLRNEPELGRKLGERARSDVETYTWRNRARNVTNFINRLNLN